MCKIYSLWKVVFFSQVSFVVVQLAFAQDILASPEELQTPPEEPQRPAVVAFVNVNVVPMDRERILQGQAVIIRGDRISEMGPVDAIDVPEGAHCIDARDKYLMPGLVDMHAHLRLDSQLTLFIASGVTTIRSMAGWDYTLKRREEIKEGKLIGPTIYTTGPILDGNPPSLGICVVVETPEQAAQVVAEQKKAGYDFIKVYNRLSLEVYDALIKAAAKHGMPVVGHIPGAVGIEHVLAAGQHTVEHRLPLFSKAEDARKLAYIARAKRIARATREAGTWICYTHVVGHKYTKNPEDPERELQMPYMKYVPMLLKQQWVQHSSHVLQSPQRIKFLVARPDIVEKEIKALHDAGVRILLGTDHGNQYTVSGFSVHQELRYLVDAGLTPYEAIKTGTRSAAECLGALNEFGTVTVGLRADLLLVEDNPLVDVGNAARRTGVMLRGQWFPQSELQAMLDALAAKHATEENPDGVMLRGCWYSQFELEAMADAQHERKKEEFVEGILSSDRIFFADSGEAYGEAGEDEAVALSFATRLEQLGFQVYFNDAQIAFLPQERKLYVGDAAVPAIGEGDLLIAVSSSEHWRTRVYRVASAAKDSGASAFLVTSLSQPDYLGHFIKDGWNIFDLVLVLPEAIVLYPKPKADFNKTAQLFVDEVVTRIIEKRRHPKPELAAILDTQNAGRIRKLVEKLANGVLSSDRIFLTGIGDSEPLACSSAMKLMQAGLRAYMVGDETTPSIAEGDVLIAVSRSGTSRMAAEIAAAKRSGASVFLLTGRSTSRIGNMSDLVFVLGPYSPREDFNKAAHLFVDELVTLITKKRRKN